MALVHGKKTTQQAPRALRTGDIQTQGLIIHQTLEAVWCTLTAQAVLLVILVLLLMEVYPIPTSNGCVRCNSIQQHMSQLKCMFKRMEQWAQVIS